MRPKIWFAKMQGLLAILVGAWVFGAVLVDYFPHAFWWQAGVSGSVGLLLVGVLLKQPKRSVAWAALSVAAFLMAGQYALWRTLPETAEKSWLSRHQGEVTLTGVIVDPGKPDSKRIGYAKYSVMKVLTARRLVDSGSPSRLSKQSFPKQPILLQLNALPVPLPPLGSVVQLTGKLRFPHTPALPGGLNEARFLEEKGIVGVLAHINHYQFLASLPERLQSVDPHFQCDWRCRVESMGYQLLRMLQGARTSITTSFQKSLPAEEAAVLGGLVLGHHATPIDKTTQTHFIQTGLIHLLAASGLNVAIMGGSVLWLLKRLRAPRWLMFLLAMLTVLFYALVTGLPPSIQRATVMFELALALKWIRQSLTPLTLLAIATWVLLLWNPLLVRNVGFEFSVLTTLGIIVMAPRLQNWLSFYLGEWLSGAVVLPFCAQLWITPLLLTYFHQLPLLSIPLNVVALLLVTPLTPLGFVAGGVSLLFPVLGQGLAWLCWPFLKALLWLAQWGSGLHATQWLVPAFPGWLILNSYLLLVGLAVVMYQSGKLPFQRVTVCGLVGLCVCLLPLVTQQGYDRTHDRLTVLPLSHHQKAVWLRAANSKQSVLIVPPSVRYNALRDLGGYLAAKQQLPMICMWPGGAKEDRAMVEAVLKTASPTLSLEEASLWYQDFYVVAQSQRVAATVYFQNKPLVSMATIVDHLVADAPYQYLQRGQGQWFSSLGDGRLQDQTRY